MKSIIVLFGICTFLIGTLLYKKCAGTLSLMYPNVISLMYYSTIVYDLIGALLIATNIINDWWIDIASNAKMSSTLSFYATYISFIMLPVFILIFEKILKVRSEHVHAALYELKMEYANGEVDKEIRQLLMVCTLFITFCLIILLKNSPEVPLVKLFTSTNQTQLAIARRTASTGIGNTIYIKNIIGRYISPFITLVWFGYFLLEKSKLNTRMFIYNLLLTGIFLFYDLTKAGIIDFSICLIVYYGIYKGKVSKKTILKVGLGISIVLILMYLSIMGSHTLSSAINSIIERVFVAQYAGTVLSFDFFPRLHGYLQGGIFVPFSSKIKSIHGTSYALLIMQYYNQYSWKAGKAGYLCSQYIAEGYSNFGYIGILLANLILALWVCLFNLIISRVRKHPMSVALISFLFISSVENKSSSLVFFVYDAGIISIFLLILAILFLSRRKLILIFRKIARGDGH